MKLIVLVLVVLLLVTSVSALSRDDPKVDRLIRQYWGQNKKYAVILAYLQTIHNVSVCMTWLKRRIKELGLCRRGQNVQYTALSCVKSAIRLEISGVNGSIGYRQMWRIMQTKFRYCVKRSTVMMLLKLLDPEGSERRRRHRLRRRVYQNKGPNYVWHLDGYDKLKPYGFSIHACIDGYSRKILWIRVAATNKEPKVILLYYLLAVFVTKGVPTLVRSDCGTENCCLAACHMTLRHQHSDQYSKEKSYRYGSSTTNTRIESWWGQLRKSVSDYWINLFKDMIDGGIFNPNLPLHKHCIAYVYCNLLEKSLNDFKDRWNSHSIRASRLSGCPAGVPDDLYQLPHLHGIITSSKWVVRSHVALAIPTTKSDRQIDYKKTLDIHAWTYCYTKYAANPRPFFPTEFEVAASAILIADFNMERGDVTTSNAKQVYTHLINIFEH